MTPTTLLQDLPLTASPQDAAASSTTPADPGSVGGLRHAFVEVLARAGAATMLSLFAYAAITQWRAAPSRITLLLLVVAACRRLPTPIRPEFKGRHFARRSGDDFSISVVALEQLIQRRELTQISRG